MKRFNSVLRYALALGAFVLIAMPAPAQQHGRHGIGLSQNHVERRVENLTALLELTDAQAASIRALFEAHVEAVQALRSSRTAADRDALHEQMQTLREDLNAAIRDVLTTEQRALYDAMHQQFGNRGEGHRGRSDMTSHMQGIRVLGGGPLFDRLGLTGEQAEKIEAIQTAHRTAIQDWIRAHPDATPEERRAYMQSQRGAMHDQIMAILTPEQIELLEELRSNWGDRHEGWRGHGGAFSGGHGGAFGGGHGGGFGGGHGGGYGGGPGVGPYGPGANATQPANATGFADRSHLGLETYPNPFNPTTEIRFELQDAQHVRLTVYDVRGREVRTLIDENRSAGPHSVTFDAASLPSGIYLSRLTAGGVVETGRMTLAK